MSQSLRMRYRRGGGCLGKSRGGRGVGVGGVVELFRGRRTIAVMMATKIRNDSTMKQNEKDTIRNAICCGDTWQLK